MTNKERMSQIGEMMDELVELGFERYHPYLSCFIIPKIMIDFDEDKVILVNHDIRFAYSSPTWQEDLLTKVKELINDNV